MFFRYIDMLSPKITLYHKGNLSHFSTFAGLLTILAYSIIAAMGIYFALDLIKRQNPTAFYFNRYIEDAGSFPLNSSSMFHYFEFVFQDNNKPTGIDFNMIRIVGIEKTIDQYMELDNLLSIDHWIYGYCNNETDTEGLGELITSSIFTESACIRKYYDSQHNKYYETNEDGFRWPSLDKGCSNENRTFYGIIIERCKNDTVKELTHGGVCKTEKEIDDFIKIRSLNFKLIDQYTDVYNYKVPFIKYFYAITNGLFKEEFATNHLNFNPATVKTHNGIFFDHVVTTLSYFFDQNEKITMSSGDTGIYTAFYFWMQNRMQYYERTYKRMQNVLADIGGMSNCILILALIINKAVNKYVILMDTENLIIETEKKNEQLAQKRKAKLNALSQKNLHEKISNKEMDYNAKKTNTNKNLISEERNFDVNNQGKSQLLRRINGDKSKNEDEGSENKEKVYERISNKGTLTNNYLLGNNKVNALKVLNKSNDGKKDNQNTVLKSRTSKIDLNFFSYILNFICKGRYNKKIMAYEKFRQKMLGEEHLIQSFLNLQNFLKMSEEDKYEKPISKESSFSKKPNKLV